MTPRLIAVLALALLPGSVAGARAAGIDGVWATDAAVCDKIFSKKGKRISFAKNADMHGSGFVIDGNRIRGKIANCTIRVRKQDGDMVNLVASCSTDVAVESVQFMLRMDGDDKLVRMFSGLPELETPYFRCRL